MPSSCSVFELNNLKSRLNRHLRFFPFPKNSEMCRMYMCHGLMNNSTHTWYIYECFGNVNNHRCQFTPDLRLFKPSTAQVEGISTNSQTQHWRTTNIWLVVTSSQALFLRRSSDQHHWCEVIRSASLVWGHQISITGVRSSDQLQGDFFIDIVVWIVS